MKKSYLMIAAAAALLTACSSNDTFRDVDTQDVEIGFGKSYIGKTTRAELTLDWFQTAGTTTTGNAFGVYADKSGTDIFTNERVYCSTATPDNPATTEVNEALYVWSHPTVRFWDKGASDAYNFYAYAPYNSTGTNPSFGSTGFTFTGLPIIAAISEDGADKAIATPLRGKDYADFAAHNAHGVNAPTVDFTFNHILSKLGFKVKTDLPKTQVVFTVKSVTIDFPAASVTWAQDALTGTDGTTTYGTVTAYDATGHTTYTVFSGSQVVPSDATGTTDNPTFYKFDNHYIVTPIGGTVTSHTFKITVVYDLEYAADHVTETNCTATGIIGNGTPAANVFAPEQNDYNIIVINIHPETIEFCVENVTSWDSETDVDPGIDVK